MFNNNVLPLVYEQGSLGASGDLAPLAMLFLPLLGLGEVNFEGKKIEAKTVLEKFGWHPIKLEAKEGLTEVNSVTDNPTVFPDDDLIVSGGNFHGEPLALALDFLAIAISELGSISERRIYRLISGERKLPAFLVANPGLNSGFMIPQYAAASIVSQNKQLCTPASVDSIPSSNEQEDHVSMGGNSATKALKVVLNTEKILAIELYNATQAMDFRRPLKTSPFLKKFMHEYRQKVAFVQFDVLMYEAINKTIEFLNETETRRL